MSEKAEKGNGGIRLKQKLKKELQMLYQPPDPVRKQEFLQRMPKGRMSNMEFLRSQTGYIRKWNWLISAAVLTGGICAAFDKNRVYTGILAAMLCPLWRKAAGLYDMGWKNWKWYQDFP